MDAQAFNFTNFVVFYIKSNNFNAFFGDIFQCSSVLETPVSAELQKMIGGQFYGALGVLSTVSLRPTAEGIVLNIFHWCFTDYLVLLQYEERQMLCLCCCREQEKIEKGEFDFSW